MPSEVKLSGRFAAMGYYGLSDGSSLKIILSKLKIDKIVLVNGNETESNSIRSELGDKCIAGVDGVFRGELSMSNISTEVCSLMDRSVVFKPSGKDDLELLYVKGHIRLRNNSRLDQVKDARLYFDRLDTINSTGKLHSTREDDSEYSFLKDFRLLQFKELLEKTGYRTVLECGRLNINNRLFVRPSEGQLVLEGVFSQEYYKVRSLLYERYLY